MGVSKPLDSLQWWEYVLSQEFPILWLNRDSRVSKEQIQLKSWTAGVIIQRAILHFILRGLRLLSLTNPLKVPSSSKTDKISSNPPAASPRPSACPSQSEREQYIWRSIRN